MEQGGILHEVLDDTVELGIFVAESRLTNGQSPKILCGLGDGLSSENVGQIPQGYRSVLKGAYTTEEPKDNYGRDVAPEMSLQ